MITVSTVELERVLGEVKDTIIIISINLRRKMFNASFTLYQSDIKKLEGERAKEENRRVSSTQC